MRIVKGGVCPWRGKVPPPRYTPTSHAVLDNAGGWTLVINRTGLCHTWSSRMGCEKNACGPGRGLPHEVRLGYASWKDGATRLGWVNKVEYGVINNY